MYSLVMGTMRPPAPSIKRMSQSFESASCFSIIFWILTVLSISAQKGAAGKGKV